MDTTPPRWQAVCKACGRTFLIYDDDSTVLADVGWPMCCDRDMSVRYHPGGVPPDDAGQPRPD